MIVEKSTDPQPRSRPSRKKFLWHDISLRMTPDQSRRQSELMREAWKSLETKDAVIAFLNMPSGSVGNRPLSLALASDDGLASARKLLAEMTRAGG